MVIVSSTICDKQGKILLSRQFQPITRHNLEECIRNFPKLIAPSQQHTFVENDQYRYIYLPVENLYLMLTTKKNSNILEDQETIRFLYKLLLDICPSGISEKVIMEKSFDILISFDDVISLGYRESVSISQVQNALQMESSEEKLHQMLMQAKHNEAQEKAILHQKEVEKKRQAMKKTGASTSNMSMQGTSLNNLTSQSDVLNQQAKNLVDEQVSYEPPKQTQKPTNLAPKKGMQLGKKKVNNCFIQFDKINIQEESNQSTQSQQNLELEKQLLQESQDVQPMHTFNPLAASFDLELVEKLSCQLTRDGALNSFEIVGELFLQCFDPNKNFAQFQLNCNEIKGVPVKLHPNLNRQMWQKQKILAMKEAKEGFPLNTVLSTLKYKYSSNSINDSPILFTYWFTDGDLTMEAEFNSEQFPAPEKPEIKKQENCDFSIDLTKRNFKWLIHKLDADTIANISVQWGKSANIEDLFPLQVVFEQKETLLNFSVKEAQNINDKTQIKFQYNQKLVADKYLIL